MSFDMIVMFPRLITGRLLLFLTALGPLDLCENIGLFFKIELLRLSKIWLAKFVRRSCRLSVAFCSLPTGEWLMCVVER